MTKKEIENFIKDMIEINLETLAVTPDATLVANLITHHLEKKGILCPDPEVK